jgi:hypothetical protein
MVIRVNTAIPVFEAFPLMLASDHDDTKDDFWVVDWKECDVPVRGKFAVLLWFLRTLLKRRHVFLYYRKSPQTRVTFGGVLLGFSTVMALEASRINVYIIKPPNYLPFL